jgi:glucokinase
MVVEVDGDPCACGGRGCVEAYASDPSMTNWALSQGWEPTDGRAAADTLAAAARDGDSIALQAFSRGARALAAGITSTAVLVDLDLVILGGGVASAGDVLFSPLRAALSEFARLEFVRGLNVVSAQLGGEAGLIGAAALAFQA